MLYYMLAMISDAIPIGGNLWIVFLSLIYLLFGCYLAQDALCHVFSVFSLYVPGGSLLSFISYLP